MQFEPQPQLSTQVPPGAPRWDRSALQREAALAKGEIAALVGRTRRRAFWLATARGLLVASAVFLAAGLCGALVSSFASAAVARALAAALGLIGLAAIAVWSWRSPLQRAALLSRTG